MPARLLVLQRVPAVSGLCPEAESATAAALRDLGPAPPGNLPETAVGPKTTARGAIQKVSRKIHRRGFCRSLRLMSIS